NEACYNHDRAADDVVPQERNLGEDVRREDGRLSCQDAEERAVGSDTLEEERENEHTEQAAVEQRSNDVHGFNQCAEVSSVLREYDRVDSPKNRGITRGCQVVTIGSALIEVPLVDVDHGNCCERVDLAGG